MLKQMLCSIPLICLVGFACSAKEKKPVDKTVAMYERVSKLKLPAGHTLKVTNYPNSERVKTLTPLNAEGKPNGLEIHKIQYGWSLTHTVPFKNGVRDGMEKHFTSVMVKRKWKTYVAKEIPWNNGKVEGAKKAYHQNGKVKSEVPHANNLPHGVAKSYNKDGQLIGETNYVKGRRQGNATDYFPTGKPKRVLPYKDGSVHGVAREFHANGKVKREITCREGEYHGTEKLYSEDGKLEKTRYWLDDDKVKKEEFEKKYKSK